MKNSRRDFLRLSGGALATSTFLPASIQRALAIAPDARTGSIQDVQHVVILMQENRSFDHYYGTLRGVRGFQDPRPFHLPDGQPNWFQPVARVKTPHYKDRGLKADATHVLPWYINPQRTTEHQAGTDHGWASGHGSWNQGRWNDWVTQKQDVLTMGHLKREDLSFHFALADAFTICDSYFSSLHGDTCPNRIFLWSGTCDPSNTMGKRSNGPGLWERAHTNGYTWTTYPERLEAAGVSWRVYQGGTGEPGAPTDNYTDNSLEFFSAYQVKEGADPQSPLVQKGATNRTLRQLRKDVLAGDLPQVSWVVAPYKNCEHPEASPTDGAYYINQVIEALTADPEVWSRTVLFLNYDENDGLFDHVVPPMPPLSSKRGHQGMMSTELHESLKHELLDLDRFPAEEHPLIPMDSVGPTRKGLQPVGLGARVPMTIISPWTRGGWVCSEVFDHTSVLRFLEARFNVKESNISAWRRSICGDLTSAFDFSRRPEPVAAHFAVPRPAKTLRQPYSVPAVQEMPQQEPGTRPSRALPYQLLVNGRGEAGHFQVSFENQGKVGAAFAVQDSTKPDAEPRRYTVVAGDTLTDTWTAKGGRYDLTVHGPHGYLRQFAGQLGDETEAEVRYLSAAQTLVLLLRNSGPQVATVSVAESYSGQQASYRLAAGESKKVEWPMAESHGWYDLVVRADHSGDVATLYLRRFAGHIESGRDSLSDPAIYKAAEKAAEKVTA
ncbi:MAG: phospholipase C, phosphocholine-specific [Acidobacteriaceae bacterium]|nr:phospholipase C, phosphocholine-specific [Acidobacteriaceae bacterium]